MPQKKKVAAKGSGSVKPTRLPQVNQFLRQNGIEGVELERGHGYFTFWGMPIHDWLNRIVVVDRLDALTLDEWLGKFQELKKQNESGNPVAPRKLKKQRKAK
jgi:hypothetical protein